MDPNMETRCVAKLANRSQCRHPAGGWYVVDAKVEPLCGTHANQREHAGARVVKVATLEGRALGRAQA
jgi:hypothetical protein